MLRQQVWNQLMEAERLWRYYDGLHKKYNKRSLITRTLLVFSGISTVVYWMKAIPQEANPELIGMAMGILLAIVVALDSAKHFEKKATILGFIASRLSKLQGKLEELWVEIEDKHYILKESSLNDELQVKYNTLKADMSEIKDWLATSDISTDEEINKKAAEYTESLATEYTRRNLA